MQKVRRSILVFLFALSATLPGFKSRDNLMQTMPILSYGENGIKIDDTQCSTDLSSDGKSLSIAAFNTVSASMCQIQFNTPEPVSGTYTTVFEEPIGKGQVLIHVNGELFDGKNYNALSGQVVILKNVSGKFKVTFNDIALMDIQTKKNINRKISGNFGCN
ncbi:MAG: hypothetical protein HOP08_01720 [Cyclobacteriaceae bacterium]|nr:hypothetical protein [Cyclobacteriaceae bacterium]